jgi:hypothetical protein
MGLDSVGNFVQVQASTGYSSSATAITLQSGQGSKLPAAPFNLIWWNSTDYPNPANDLNVEIVRVTNISSDTITVSRAQAGTSAAIDHQLRVFGSYDRGLLALGDAGRTYLRIQVHLNNRPVDLDHRVSRCSLVGAKQKSRGSAATSVFDPIADASRL